MTPISRSNCDHCGGQLIRCTTDDDIEYECLPCARPVYTERWIEKRNRYQRFDARVTSNRRPRVAGVAS